MNSGRPSGFKAIYGWMLALFLLALFLSLKTPMGQRMNLAMAPLVHIAQSPVRWYHDFSLWFEQSDSLQSAYLQLEQTTQEQASLKQELSVLRTENAQLRALLKITQVDGFDWHAARVVSRGQEEKSRRLMLKVTNAVEDDVVVSQEGLVGLVDTSDTNNAVVRTILDASIAVPVTKKGSQLAALVRGDGEHLLVDFVALDKAPNIGDILVTSGSGGLFPAGLPVARVDKVTAVAGGVFAEVIASPVSAWGRDAWLAVAARQKR